MVAGHHTLMNIWFYSILSLAIALTLLLPCFALFGHMTYAGLHSFISDPFFHHVIGFTFIQAFASALFSLVIGLGVARALARRHFYGRRFLLQCFELSFVIPVMVLIFGLIKVHGQQGYLSQLIGDHFPDYIYGLGGILLTHCCLNIPFVSRILLAQLEQIPPAHWRIASQLGLSDSSIFKTLDWPCLKKTWLELFALVFFLCFTSFTTILTLGGGPQSTTLEVAVYQALRVDFDIEQAGFYACVQLLLCSFLLFILHKKTRAPLLQKQLSHNTTLSLRPEKHQASARIADSVSLTVILLLYFPPLLALLCIPWKGELAPLLGNQALWDATCNSFKLAFTCGFFSVALALILSLLRCRLQHPLAKLRIDPLILIIPPVVLATGWFVLLHNNIDVFTYGFVFVCWINILMAQPFIHPNINTFVHDHYQRYTKLAQSLGVFGFNHWRAVDWPCLKKPLLQAFSFSFLLSLGDLSAVAFFHSPGLETLPWLLYQQLGHYQQSAAHVTAAFLILFCLLFILTIHYFTSKNTSYHAQH